MSGSHGPDLDLTIRPYVLDDSLWQTTAADGKARVEVYVPPRTMVVLGRGSRPEVELDLDRCREDEVPVFRRKGGGCSVVVDRGNVIVSTTLPVDGLGHNRALFDGLTRWLMSGLVEIGIEGVSRAGSSDLVVGDRKVGGSCIHRAKGLLLFSSTLLIDPDVELMERYLALPPREPGYRRGRSHRDFVGRLEKAGLDGASVARELRGVLQPVVPMDEEAR